MPELPEVEVVRRGVAQHAIGRTIAQVDIRGDRVARRHVAGPMDLADRLAGGQLLAADRRGKYLWLVVQTPDEDPQALVVHLGMSGQLLVDPAQAPRQKHAHAIFTFTDGDPQLRFVDQRTFGGLALTDLAPDHRGGAAQGEHPHGIPASVTHIAADPLEAAFDLPAVVRVLKTKDTAIKRLLLDQNVVSGIGNIYADEALWRAKIHGARPASSLTKPALTRLLEHATDVMTAALDVGGTSFDALYVNINGQSGYFDRSLDAYGQTGQPCTRCGTLIQREVFMNRSSHFCPMCQPAPRGSR
ncbi:bifunctional DNA-formamidopyrimidine glycosylase/DNA-(apurinic or apyrimidinic site) lyase [Ornithinimicrobium sp. Arc0846-15]|nr:bifunctional DNA-formamidopyrimidine glycosylase/DNA-(apurinic or apyrimidinic site) lyase [Ornithinimicrobium laminariae]